MGKIFHSTFVLVETFSSAGDVGIVDGPGIDGPVIFQDADKAARAALRWQKKVGHPVYVLNIYGFEARRIVEHLDRLNTPKRAGRRGA